MLTGREAVAAAEKAVADLQRGITPTIYDRLIPEWSDV
jgi:hypothetical protein